MQLVIFNNFMEKTRRDGQQKCKQFKRTDREREKLQGMYSLIKIVSRGIQGEKFHVLGNFKMWEERDDQQG